MKKIYFLSALLAAGLLTACSSDDGVTPTTSVLDKFNAQGEAYISLNLNLPTTTAGTRADDNQTNDQYDEGGTTGEYAVTNDKSVFVLLSGTSEATATVKSAYVLNPSTDWAAVSANTAIAEASVTQGISKAGISANDKIYAFVILNHGDLIKVQTVGDNANGLTDASDASLLNKTLAELNAALTIPTAKLQASGTNFIMTNAPMASRASGATGAATITTLSEIDPSKIYTTAAVAEANPAAKVYVERAAAKIQVTTDVSSATLETDATIGYDKANIVWVVDNQAPTGPLTRTFDVAWIDYRSVNKTDDAKMPYRFTSLNEIEPGASLYRTYWATENSATLGGKTTTANFDSNKKTLSEFAYCNENATAVDNMKEEKATRVVIGVPFNGGTTFYTISTQSRDKIYTEENAKKYVQSYLASQANVRTWFETYFDGDASLATVIALSKVTLGGTAPTIDDIDATLTGVDLSSYTFKGSYDADAAITAFNALSEVSDIGAFTMSKYTGGIAYYPVFVKHFGETYTPWPDTDGTTTATVYVASAKTDPANNRDARYLGRWGIVRNNWYIINVGGVKHIGEPDIPDLTTGTPLDQIENYLSLEIKVLPWAKRTQNVIL